MEVWVDVAARGPGEGTRQKPWSSLAEALARPGPLTVHLAPGEYRGSFTLPEDVRLEGEGPTTVLVAQGPEDVVLRASGPGERSPEDVRSRGPESRVPAGTGQPSRAERGVVWLRNLSIRGGAWGVEVTHGRWVRAEKVVFTGQHRGGARVGSGRLDVEASSFESTASETVGLVLDAPPEASASPVPARAASLRDTAFSGPFRRAVRVRGAGASATLEGVTVAGAVTALGMDGGHAEVRRSSAREGSGAAFSVVEGTLVLEDVRVMGHELGLSAMHAPRLEVRGFHSVGARRAGLAVVASRNVLLEDVVVRDSGSHGALQLTGSEVDARRLQVEGAAEYGVLAVGGHLRLRGATVSRVRSADDITGDGLHLRQVSADVEGVVVRGVTGTCVLAAQRARVVMRDAELERCGQAALLVDTLAVLDARGVDARDSPGTTLAAMGDGELRVDALRSEGSKQGLVWTECTGATRILLGRVDTEDARGTQAPCVERAAEPARSPR